MFFSWRNWLHRKFNPHRRRHQPARRRRNSQRVFLRLEECERMELPNGLMAAAVPSPPEAAVAAAEAPFRIVGQPTSDGLAEVREKNAGDSDDWLSYNAVL